MSSQPESTAAEAKPDTPASRDAPLRIWPAVVIVLFALVAVFGTAKLAPGTQIQFLGMVFGPMIAGLLACLWWLFASRRPTWKERVTGVILVIGAGAVAFALADPSIIIALVCYSIPSILVAVTAWFLLTRAASWNLQRFGALTAALLAAAFWCLVRSEGVDGTVTPDLAWRWSPTIEQKYVASLKSDRTTASPEPDEPTEEVSPVQLSIGDWPGFRGPQRDGRLEGVEIDPDWEANPPREVWRRLIGPAWSSFAVVGKRVYTQEQRDEEEVVLCLDSDTGEQVWMHRDRTRFWEAMAGAGPRATPTFADGKIYTIGAKGIVNCLDARLGRSIWTRDVAADSGAKVPMWGFSSSPLVRGEVVMVYAGGGDGHGVVAYDSNTGELLWQSGGGTHSYSSPQFVEIEGVPQVLMLTEMGAFSLVPDSGEILWEHDWHVEEMNRVVQPSVFGNRVLLGTGFGIGTRSLTVSRGDDSWSTTEDWTSRGMKPYYNDCVIYDGHAFGFDNNIFACINLADGKRVWKRGRYGNGQVLLIADQGLLLVLSEKGRLVLLEANPDKHTELASFPAIRGKTWNHPVIAHGRLYVRNSEEAACFELGLAEHRP